MNLHDSRHTLHRGAPAAHARGALLFLHGRGADAEDILGLADALPTAGISLVAPSARQNTWYPQRFFVPIEQNEPWLSSGIELIDQTVAGLHEAGIPYERIGLIGFSQGGCLALEYAARHPRRYGLIAGLSGSLIGPPDLPRPSFHLRSTPVLLGCAEHDPHIPLPYVERSAQLLAGAGADVTKQLFSGYDHTVFPQEIDWLQSRISTWAQAQ